MDPNYRRLRYIRYADDFLLGFTGPKKEAEEIRHQLSEYLRNTLKLTLSVEKTFITHAHDEKAHFLGYEITVTRDNNLITTRKSPNGVIIKGRRANGSITLLMPQKVIRKYHQLYSNNGRITHKAELLPDTVHTSIQRYQSVLKGLYNYYCMATNVSRRMGHIKWILETSLTKTLASKLRCSVSEIYRRYKVVGPNQNFLREVTERPGKDPLLAIFGGFPLERNSRGLGVIDFDHQSTWFKPGGKRSEVVQRLLAGKCELCDVEGPMAVHHIRKLADIDQPGQRPKANWERVMSARKRKTLVVCTECHTDIHAGRHDGPKL